MRTLSLLLGMMLMSVVQAWAWELADVNMEYEGHGLERLLTLHLSLSDGPPRPGGQGITGLGRYFSTEADALEFMQDQAAEQEDAPHGMGLWHESGWVRRPDFSAMVQQQMPMPEANLPVEILPDGTIADSSMPDDFQDQDMEVLLVRSGAVVWELSLWNPGVADAREQLESAARALFQRPGHLLTVVALMPLRVEGQGHDLELPAQVAMEPPLFMRNALDLDFSYDSTLPVDLAVHYQAVELSFLPGQLFLDRGSHFESVDAVVDLGESPQSLPLSWDGVLRAHTDSLTRFRAVSVILRQKAGSEVQVMAPMVRLLLRDTAQPWTRPAPAALPQDPAGFLAQLERFFCPDTEGFAPMLEAGVPDCTYVLTAHAGLARAAILAGEHQGRVFGPLVERTLSLPMSGDSLDGEVEQALLLNGLAGTSYDMAGLLETRLSWPTHGQEFLEPDMWSAETARATLDDLSLFQAAGAPQAHAREILDRAGHLVALVVARGPVDYDITKDTRATIHEDPSPLPLALAALACLKAYELFPEQRFADAAMGLLDRLYRDHTDLAVDQSQASELRSWYARSVLPDLVLAAHALRIGSEVLGVDDYYRGSENIGIGLASLWDADSGAVPGLERLEDVSHVLLPVFSLEDQLALSGLANRDAAPWW